MNVESHVVPVCDMADNFYDKRRFYRGDLGLDPARHVESRRLPVGEREISAIKLRCQRNKKGIARMTAKADQDGWPDFAAAQIRERDRQQDDVIARAIH